MAKSWSRQISGTFTATTVEMIQNMSAKAGKDFKFPSVSRSWLEWLVRNNRLMSPHNASRLLLTAGNEIGSAGTNNLLRNNHTLQQLGFPLPEDRKHENKYRS